MFPFTDPIAFDFLIDQPTLSQPARHSDCSSSFIFFRTELLRRKDFQLFFFSNQKTQQSRSMPPKNKQDEEKKVLLGRISKNLKVGIVGVPNVG